MVYSDHSNMSVLLQLGKSESLLQRQFSSAGPDHSVERSRTEDRQDPVYHATPATTTYASCFGLPYQDHNYGAPPPPTPPASPPPAPLATKLNGHIEVDDVASTAVVTTTESEPVVIVQPPIVETADDSITRCICGFQHDDGYMICCDKCVVWQHVDCMFIDRNDIPDLYWCEICQPRHVDRQRAILIQTRKRDEILGTSSTESETETKQGVLKKFKKGKKVRLDFNEPLKKNDLMKKKKVLKKFKRVQPLSQKENKKITIDKKIGKKSDAVARKAVARALKGTRSNSAPLLLNGSNDPRFQLQDHSYEEATGNLYSTNIQNILATIKPNGSYHNSNDIEPSSHELRAQLCAVAQINPTSKGLEALDDLSSNQAIIEYRGKVMLREQFDQEYSDSASPIHPYTLFYAKFDNLDLCIDASIYGNDARYIGRSCTPNSEVRHVVENGQVLFFIYSTKSIPRSAEVTIPFDYSYHNSKTHVECPCARASCPVAKAMKKMKADGQKPKVLKKSKRILRAKSTDAASPEKSPVRSPLPITRRRKSSPARAPLTPKKESVSQNPEPVIDVQSPTKESPTATGPCGEVKSESEEDPAEKRKKMTREERKMEAIMRAFEKLEKREERRKEAINRLGGEKPERRKSIVKEEPPAHTPAKGKGHVKVASIAQEKTEAEPELETVEVKEEKPIDVVKPEPKPRAVKGKRRKGYGTPARRRSRYNSSSSGIDTSASMSAEESLPVTPASSVPVTPIVETPNSATMPIGFRFPKTKKQMMNEWLTETGQEVTKPLSIKTEPEDTTSSEEYADYIKHQPSPRTSLDSFRRNSLSSPRAPLDQLRRYSTNSTNVTPKGGASNTGMGSAKKRWLRQAMVESSASDLVSGCTSPSYNELASPTSQQHSPDFVTPLKKRRLARESMSSEGPSTPSGPVFAGSGSLDQDETSQHSSVGEVLTSPGREEAVVRLKNGFRSHFSPVTPSTSSNIFERLKPGSHLEEEPGGSLESKEFDEKCLEENEMDCSTNKLNDSCNSSLESVDSGEDCILSLSRTLCDSTVSGDRRTNEVNQNNEASPSSASALSTIQEEAMEVDNIDVNTSIELVGSSEKSKQLVGSSENCDISRPEIKQLVESSENRVGNFAESSENSTSDVASSGVQLVCKSDTADTTSTCTNMDLSQGPHILSCSTDSEEHAQSNVDSSCVTHSLTKLADSSMSSVNLSHGRPDSDTRTLVNVGSSDSSVSNPASSESISERTVASSSSVDIDCQSGHNVLLCSSSSSSSSAELKPEVSASTDTEALGVSVSTSQDISDVPVANSSEEQEIVSADNTTSGDKLNTSESAPEITSSKLREDESELEEGEIVDSSEDEVETSESKDQNVHSSSSSNSNNNPQESEKCESMESADSASSVTVSASDSVSIGKESSSNSEVDSTSSHSTRTNVVSGHQGADSSVSGLLDSEFSLRRTSLDVPCSSCHQLMTSSSSRADSSAVDSTVGSSSLSHEKKKTKVSLLEYRQRRRSTSRTDRYGDSHSDHGSRSGSRGNSPRRSSSRSSRDTPTLAPLPLFDRHSPRGKRDSKDEARWAMSATLAERHRENTQMSLTERLRKEFGLSDNESDNEEEEEKKADTPPPPPPPRPVSQATMGIMPSGQLMVPQTMTAPPGVSRIGPLPGQSHVVMTQPTHSMAIPPPPVGVPSLVAAHSIPHVVPATNSILPQGIPPPPQGVAPVNVQPSVGVSQQVCQGVPPPNQGVPSQIQGVPPPPPQGMIPQGILPPNIQSQQIIHSQLPPLPTQSGTPSVPQVAPPTPQGMIPQGVPSQLTLLPTPPPSAIQGRLSTQGLLHAPGQNLEEQPLIHTQDDNSLPVFCTNMTVCTVKKASTGTNNMNQHTVENLPSGSQHRVQSENHLPPIEYSHGITGAHENHGTLNVTTLANIRPPPPQGVPPPPPQGIAENRDTHPVVSSVHIASSSIPSLLSLPSLAPTKQFNSTNGGNRANHYSSREGPYTETDVYDETETTYPTSSIQNGPKRRPRTPHSFNQSQEDSPYH